METIFTFLITGLLGLATGSFAAAVLWRSRLGISIFSGRSGCISCQTKLVGHDLIPVASYIWLKGKCRSCNSRISWQYPAIEAAVCTLFIFLLAYHQTITALYVRDLIVAVLLVCVFVYDARHKEILDRFTTVPALLLIPFTFAFQWLTWQQVVLGVLIGAGFFLVQYIVSKGKWIGGGDVRLGLLMGVVLGWPNILVALFISYIVGAVVSIALVVAKKKTLASETPFGTYLAVGTFIAMVWGSEIVRWYTNLIF